MSSKTFEGVDGTRLLHIKNLGKHVTMSIEVPGQVHMGITFDPASIPELALAELEAAGHGKASDSSRLMQAFDLIELHVNEQERITAEAAKEQAELEAEALELCNSHLEIITPASFPGKTFVPLSTWDGTVHGSKESWVATLLKAREIASAREMRAEK